MSPLDEAMWRGATVLAPSERVMRQCLRRYDAERQREGTAAWPSPEVRSWNAWVGSLWHDAQVRGVECRVLLNSVQEHFLWKETISEETQATTAQVRLCASAVRLLGTYDIQRSYFAAHVEGTGFNKETFARWYARFERRCSSEGYLPAAFAEIELTGHVLQRNIEPAAEYALYGFVDFTPAQKKLIAALRGAGSHVEEVSPPVLQKTPPTIVSCGSACDEERACAAWVRERVICDPSAAISIVVPVLDAVWPELERELRAAVAPELSDVTRGEQQPRYEFSSGRPLSRLPLIVDALRLLRWCIDDLPVEEAGALLRSQHLTLAPSPDRGAELDAYVLRQATLLRGEVSLQSAARILRKHDETTAQRLEAIDALTSFSKRRSATYADFAGYAREILAKANWAGGTELNSEEYQAVDRWNEALDRLSTLDLFGREVTFSAAMHDLSFIANEMLFATENTGASIQVMTWTESVGSTADALWFLHADENTLLARRSPHPLLAPDFQRHAEMPGTRIETDEYAASLALQRLAESSREAVFSYASTNAEGAQRIAPVLEQLAANWGATQVESSSPELASAGALLEFIEDSTLLPALLPGIVHGGVDVITKQSQCPFRAFAEHRLYSSPLEPIQAGYSYRDRGEHVHDVLCDFWNEVGDHATLVKYTRTYGPDGTTERDALLHRLINAIYDGAPGGWEAAYRAVQPQRLFRLLSAWLDLEMKRVPFTVSETEKEIPSASLGPLLLKLRVDRIDTVANGDTEAKLLIDYKTGPADVRQWSGERPDQPQLPVYAVASGVEKVEAIAFGKIQARDKNRCLTGSGTDDNPFGSIITKTAFQEKLSEWQSDLVRLATAFAEGDTSVDPKEYPTSCEFCGQRMLCRVEEDRPLELDDPEDHPEVLEWQ